LELELDARLLRDRLAHLLDELERVARGAVALVHEVVGVQRRDLDAADGEPLEPAFVDQHPRRLRPAGILERRPAARLIEGRAHLPPAEQLALQLLQLGRRLLAETELRLDHDPLDVARAVLERDLLAGELFDLPLRVHHADFRDDFGELRAVAAGVHIDAAAHGARNPEEALHTSEPRLGGTPRENRRRHAAPDDRGRPLHLEAVEPLAQADHDAREAAVFQEDVRPQAEHDPGETALVRQLERLDDVFDVAGQDEIPRRAAQAPRGVAPQRLVLEHLPAELDLGGRRRRRRRLCLWRRFRCSLRYALTATSL